MQLLVYEQLKGAVFYSISVQEKATTFTIQLYQKVKLKATYECFIKSFFQL